MAKYCTKCGSKLDEKTGKCPNCEKQDLTEANGLSRNDGIDAVEPVDKYSEGNSDEQKSSIKNKKNNSKGDKRSHKHTKKRVLVFIVVMVFISIGLVLANYFGFINIPVLSKVMGTDIDDQKALDTGILDENSYTAETIDAEEYYRKKGKIIEVIDVEKAKEVLSEKEVMEEFRNRGFSELELYTLYDIDGTYHAYGGIDSKSDEKHPYYQANYVTENGEYWTILVIDNCIYALPVSYNLTSSLDISVIVSEEDTVLGYDSVTNKFYRTAPDEGIKKIVVVDRIDANTIDKIDLGSYE